MTARPGHVVIGPGSARGLHPSSGGHVALEMLPPFLFWPLVLLGAVAFCAALLALAVWWPFPACSVRRT